MAYPNAEGRGNYHLEPSIEDVETWLDWCACQLNIPCWWMELTTIPGVGDPRKLAQKIWASFSIPVVRSQVFPGQGYTAPPAPKCLTWNVFLPDELSYQDVQQQPFSLNHGLCLRITVLGRETQPTSGSRFLPLGKESPRAEREGERVCHLY